MSTELASPRVVELVRVSTEGQRDKATHEVQRQALDALRKNRPGVVVKRLEALGVSGAKGLADRADLQELDRLSRSKAYDELRVFSVDRLTRSDDPRERAAIYGMVLDAGAKIVDVNGRVIDPCDESGMGELDYTMQGIWAARERKKIAERTRGGRKLAASQGKLSQGLAPYGRVLNRASMTWELVPDEVEIYRRVITEFLEGLSTRQIAKRLNAERVPPRVRGRWGKSTILRLLTTPAIVGRYETCGHTTAIPPIATAAEWDKIRAMLKTNASVTKGKPIEAALRGRLVCAACGMLCRVESDGKGWVRYVCPKPSQRDGRPPCPDRRGVEVRQADEAVRVRLEAEFKKDPEGVDLLQGKRKAEDPKREMKRIEKRLAELVTEEARALRLLNRGSLSEEAAELEFERIKFARAELDAKRADLAQAPKPVRVEETLSAYRRLQEEFDQPDGVKRVLSQILPPNAAEGLSLTRHGVEIKANVFGAGWELIARC